MIDTAAVAAEAKLDGKDLLSASNQHLSPTDIALGDKNLLKADRGFRDMSSGGCCGARCSTAWNPGFGRMC